MLNNRSALPANLKTTLQGIKQYAELVLEIFKEIRSTGELYIALGCGLWNGLMDTIGGVFGLVKLVIQLISGSKKIETGIINYATKADYYNSLALEYLDNMLAAAIKIDWVDIIKSAVKGMKEIIGVISQIPEFLLKKITEINHTEVGYYVGYMLFEIASWSFPPIKIAQLVRLVKLAKFDKIRKASKILPDAFVSKGNNLIDAFFEFIEPFIKKLKEGTESLKEFINDVIRRFKEWLQDLFTSISKTSDEVTDLFRKAESRTSKGEVRFRRPELSAFARKLEKKYAHLNLKVNIVTDNNIANKLRLKKWDSEGVLGSFAPGPPPVIHVRQRCTRLTMQHEIWHLEDYNRLGIQEYKKIVNWKHEESVWFKVLENKHLWSEVELIDSYEYYLRTVNREGGIPVINQEIEKLIKK